MAARSTIPRSRQTHAAPPASPLLPSKPHHHNRLVPTNNSHSHHHHVTRNTALVPVLLQTTASEWIIVLSLIFGGCCSNAWALELSTTQLPQSGTLITFAQFLTTTLFCLPRHLYLPSRSLLPRLRPRAVPLSRWFVQVALYFSTSLLNNMAFACSIPMPVHIVFRSAGLVINMILGWAVQKRKYTPLQIASVLLVTAGVISSTLYSSSPSPSSSSSTPSDSTQVGSYIQGVLLLLLALLLTGLMGLWQEKTFRVYGTSNWRESLFYSHLLSLPIFLLRRDKLISEIRLANQTEKWWIGVGRPRTLGRLSPFSLVAAADDDRVGRTLDLSSHLSLPSSLTGYGIEVPFFYLPLLLNVLTQLLCINGVNSLTSKVSSLTVTLVLVVRKALSLVISVMLVGEGKANAGLWIGASTVLLGTIAYSLAGSRKVDTNKKEQHKKDL